MARKSEHHLGEREVQNPGLQNPPVQPLMVLQASLPLPRQVCLESSEDASSVKSFICPLPDSVDKSQLIPPAPLL